MCCNPTRHAIPHEEYATEGTKWKRSGYWDRQPKGVMVDYGAEKMQGVLIIVKFIIKSLWTKIIWLWVLRNKQQPYPICLADQRTQKMLWDGGETRPCVSEWFKIGLDGATLGHHDIFFLFWTFILTLNVIWMFAWDNLWNVLSPLQNVIYKTAGFVGGVLRHPLTGQHSHSEVSYQDGQDAVKKCSHLSFSEQKATFPVFCTQPQ